MAVILLASLLPGDTERLAGEPSANKVNWFEVVFSDFSHISVSLDVGPMFFEDSVAEVIYLYLPFALHSGPFEAKVETADTREEGAEGHRPEASIISGDTGLTASSTSCAILHCSGVASGFGMPCVEPKEQFHRTSDGAVPMPSWMPTHTGSSVEMPQEHRRFFMGSSFPEILPVRLFDAPDFFHNDVVNGHFPTVKLTEFFGKLNRFRRGATSQADPEHLPKNPAEEIIFPFCFGTEIQIL